YNGYIGIIDIKDVNTVQKWTINEKELVVCDSGIKWFIIAPDNESYVITMIIDLCGNPIVWYIDMIDGVGKDEDGMIYFNDIFLDLIVSNDGVVIEDDRDELELALTTNILTKEQYNKADFTARELTNKISSDFIKFKLYCMKLFDYVINSL
ncbi:DUF402 domain-containing protein, partial [Serratia marcescens]|uniref:DUF402 domain-containing protein n=1 Tax=Serratia marcescens TaxID=615 RepID=UPI0011E7D4F4